MTDWHFIEKDKKAWTKERKKARELRQSQWWKNIIAQGNCHYCKGTFTPKQLTMDHLVPIARGGKSTKANIVPACKACNQEKKLATPVEIILKQLHDDKS